MKKVWLLLFLLVQFADASQVTSNGGGVDCTTGTGVYTSNGSSCSFQAVSGTGTVTSVGMTLPSWLTVTGSPITTTGTLAVTGASQSANLFLASPNGSSGAMTPRAIATADLPTWLKNNSLSASLALITDASGYLANSSTTSTELGYVHGVTSALQTQLNAKAASGSNSDITSASGFTGAISSPTYIDHTQTTTPANPAASHDRLYFKSDDNLYMLSSGGTETKVNGGGGGSPGGSSGNLQYDAAGTFGGLPASYTAGSGAPGNISPTTDGSATAGLNLGIGGASPQRYWNGFFGNYLSVGNPTGQANGWTNNAGNGIGLDVGTAGTNVALQAYVNGSNSGILNLGTSGTWSLQSGGNTHFIVNGSVVDLQPGGALISQVTGSWGMQLFKPLWFSDLGSALWIGYQAGTGLGRPEITFTGGLALKRTGTATSYTTVRGDGIIGVTDTSVARTISLQTASAFAGGVTAGAVGKQLIIKDESGAAGTNHITITPNGTETIDGVNASVSISTNYGVVRLYSDANGHWFTW